MVLQSLCHRTSPPHRTGWSLFVTLTALIFDTKFRTACIAGVAHLVLALDPTAPAPPSYIIPLGLAGYCLPLCTNVMVTSLIVYRIWSSSSIMPGSTETVTQSVPYRAIMLIVESGMLYLVTQLVYVILFAMNHPAVGIVAVMAVQIYVRFPLHYRCFFMYTYVI